MANVNSAKTARPPRLIYSLLEGRALLEAAMLPMLLPVLNGTPRGDGHPVMLVPGFTAGDATMIGLKTFLRSRGYHVETWGFGQNTGFKLKFSQALDEPLHIVVKVALHTRHEAGIAPLTGKYPQCRQSNERQLPSFQFFRCRFNDDLGVTCFTV